MLRAAAACVALGVPLCASAATITWTGGGADDKWSTAANWGTSAPVPDDALVFAGLVRPTPSNDFAAGLNFSGITFSAGAAPFTLGGNPINLGGANVGVTVGNTAGMGITNGVTNNSSNRQTINFGLTLNAGNHLFNGGTGGLTLAGGVARNPASPGGIALFTPGAGGITVSGATLQNGILGGWALSGSNWATLNASNQIVAYSAYTDVAPAGTLTSDPTSNVRVNTFGGNITMAAGGTTDVNTIQYNGAAGGNQTIDPGAGNVVRLGASGGIMRTGSATNAVVIGAANNSGVLTAGGADNTAGEIVLATNTAANTNNTITINSTVTDNGSGAVRVVKTGQSAANLNGTNTYTGGTFISEGRVGVGNVNALGTGPITITGLGQAFLPSGTMTNNWFISGIGTAEAGGHGAIRLSNGSVLSGTVTLIGNARIATRGNGTGGTVNGNIVGPYALELGGYDNDAGDITTIAGAGNAWAGGTTLSQQIILRLGASEVIPNGTAAGNVTLNVSTDLDRSAILDLNGFNETINGLSRTGSAAPSAAGADRAAIRNNGGAASVLTIGDNNASGSYTGVIQDNSGTGSTLAITKIGGGLQSFGGTNLTYTGDTNVNGGTLAINGLLTASAVKVNTLAANATLGGSGTVAGNVTLAADTGANKARINPGASGAGSSGTLTLNTLAVNGGDLQFDLVAPGTSDMINATGLVNFNAPSTISPSGGTTGSYTLLTSTSPIVYAPGAVPTINPPGGTGNTRPATYVLDTATNPNAILLNVTGGAGSLVWSGVVNGNWNLNTDPNWKNGVAPDKFYNQDTVTFDDTSVNPSDVQLVGTLAPGALTVNAARNYTFAGAGGISGATGLTKNGAGTLVIANTGTNDFTGPIVIGGGTLQVGNGGTAGALPATPVTNNAALVFNRSDTVTYGGAISGAGTLEQRGPGLLILGGANTYTGATTVTAGTLRPTTAAGIGAAAATVAVVPGATFDVNGLNLQGHVFTVSGTGVGGVGALTNASTVDQINATQKVVMAGDTTFGATGRWDIRGSLTTAYLKTNGNPYKLTKVGSGQLSLVGVDVDSALGDIDIKDGILGFETTTNRMGDPTKTVTISPTATLKFYGLGTAMEKVAVSNGGRFWTENGNGNTFSGPITLNATSTFENTGGTTTTFNGPIGGAGGVIKVNTGTTVFGNANTYTGINTINGGVLSVMMLANGSLPSGLGQSSTAPANLVLAGGTLGFSGTAAASTDRQFTLGGTGGGLDASGASGATVNFTSTAPIVVTGSGPLAFTLSGINTDENVLAAKVVNGTGATAVTKNGAGTWTLANANTYTGPTTINAGILRVKSLANGGVASGIGQSTAAAANLVIANGGTLSYSGTAPASTDRQLTLAGTGGSLDASGAAGAPVVFSGTAPVVLNTGTSSATLTFTGSNIDANVFAGQLVDGSQQTTTLVKDGPGTWTLSGASTHTGATTVAAGTLRVTGSIARSDVNVNGGGTLDAAATQTLKTLAIQSNGSAVVSGAARKVLVVGDHTQSTPLQIFGGRLDLTTNALIVNHDVNSVDQPLVDLRTLIIAGYNASAPGMGDGKWDGNGIVSSSTGSSGAVGYAKASELTSPTFFDQPVDSSVVARYTLAGDANLDGTVDFLDLAKLAQSYNTTVSTTTESWWTHGDFNYDGNVDFLDLAKMAQNYNTALPTSPIAGAPADFQADLARAFASVPEPGAVGLLGLCGAALMTRRQRRR